MSASCCDQPTDAHRGNDGYRRVLWVVLAINAAMFAVEVAAGLAAGLGVAPGRCSRLSRRCRKLRHQPVRRRHGAALSRARRIGEGRDHGRVRPVGDRGHRLAYLARHRAPKPSPWAQWALPRYWRMRSPSDFFGRIAAATPICARPGSAPETTCSGISPCCWPPSAFGTGTGWPDVTVAALWRVSPCREPG